MIEPRLHPRFWSKIKIGKPSDCWEWQAAKVPSGYGTYTPPEGKPIGAHRIAYALVHGPIPPGKCILHRCDNPPCCNPSHLRVGTIAENNAERSHKGRNGDYSRTGFSTGAAQGERNRHAKLKEADVIEIRKAVAHGANQRELARRYGLSPQNLWNLVHYRTWKHVA